MKITHRIFFYFYLLLLCNLSYAQNKTIASVTASVNEGQSALAFDNNPSTGWKFGANDLRQDQFIQFALQTSGDVTNLKIIAEGLSKQELQNKLRVYVTYDPMNPGEPVAYSIKGNSPFLLTFNPKYGAHVKLIFKNGIVQKTILIKEIEVGFAPSKHNAATNIQQDKAWLNTKMPLNDRVESLLSAMTPADKMELLREGWGIPGIAHLGIPAINKVEAVHGYSYGSGATIFPQAIAMGATWDKKLIENVGETLGDETVSANTKQCWSPVLDVAQDARWGRCEETFGEDPVLVSEIGGAWIKGYQSKGLFTTPKHFAGHGAPLGGRDSHDIGL